jgi:hypothetical protein
MSLDNIDCGRDHQEAVKCVEAIFKIDFKPAPHKFEDHFKEENTVEIDV